MTTPSGGDFAQQPGSQPANVAGGQAASMGQIVRRTGRVGVSRAKVARESRRAQQFAKFRLTELNLVPLVDTFVSIVFFALTTAAVGELAPVVRGVNLPESAVGGNAMRELTVGIGSNLTVAGRPVMSTQAAAQSQSNQPGQPLLIPELYAALRAKADSVRAATSTDANTSIDMKLAVQGDRSMRYDLLSRVLQTARLAGFKNVSLQVNRTGADEGASVPVQTQASLD